MNKIPNDKYNLYMLKTHFNFEKVLNKRLNQNINIFNTFFFYNKKIGFVIFKLNYKYTFDKRI